MPNMKNEENGSIREEDIPDILKNPPWAIGEPIVAALEPLPDEEAIVWPQKLEARLDRILQKDGNGHKGKTPEELLRELHIKDSAHARILQGDALTPDDFDRVQYRVLSLDVRPLASLPPRAALAVWQSTPVKYWSDYYSHEFSDDFYFLLRKLGLAFVPGLVKFACHHLEDRVRLLLPCRSAQVVPVIASALANTKHARDAAQEWLSAYPDTAARALIPAALGENRKPREDALTALLWLAHNGFEDTIKAVASDYVDATSGKARSFPRRRAESKPEPVSWTSKFLSSIGRARLDERPPENSDPADDAEPAPIPAGDTGLVAVLTRLARNPRLFLYAQMSGLPDFFVPGVFRHPQLKAGGALPNPALTVLGQMLAIGAWFEAATGQSTGEPFDWLAEIKAVCVSESLSDFVWDVFEAWHSAGMPPSGKWALFALGRLGHDSSAVRLASRIRQWEAEKKRARVISGMDMLEAIGTDAALAYLDGLSYQFKKQNLRDVARQKIERIAKARGLSADQLADRLVPDLGLDASGGLRLDFGPRQFSVGFDENLKPFVRDDDGRHLKDLPKPNRKDDDAKAPAAAAAYKELKKSARAIDSLQIRRLEMAMCTRRRWSAADFRRFFCEHPLMRHLARRLVWGVYDGDDGALRDAFRVAEDATPMDRNDDPYTLPEGAAVGISHRLEMDGGLCAAFGQVFADYEILQPFRQLDREIYTLTKDELQSRAVTRFNGKKVAPGSLMGLTSRGWRREVGDGGYVTECVKPLAGATASLRFEEGFPVGEVGGAAQTLVALILTNAPTAADALAVSELLRDVDLLAAVEV